MGDKKRKESRSLARFSSIRFWIGRNCVPTSYWEREFRAIGNLYSDDWRAWTAELDSAFTWATYRVTVVGISFTGVAFGIGQFLTKLTGG